MKEGPLTMIARLIETLTHRARDGEAINARRFAAIENRLAVIDGGADARLAAEAALCDIAADRVRAGDEPLSFRLGADGAPKWGRK